MTFVSLTACKKSQEPEQSKTESSPSTRPSTPAESAPAQASAPAPGNGESVLLAVKWPIGNRYVYRMDMEQRSTNRVPGMPKPIQQDLNLGMTYALSALKERPEGGSEVELEFLANEMEIKMGGQTMMSFDSKEPSTQDGQNPFAGPFRKMVGSKVILEMDKTGRVEKIVGYDEWIKSIQGDATGAAGGMVSQQFNEGFLRQISAFGLGLPNKPVHVGDKWPFELEVPAGPLGKISIQSNVSFKGWEDHNQHKSAVLGIEGVLSGTPGQEVGPMGKMSIENGKITGNSWFDPELGALIESAQDQVMRLKGEIGGQAGPQAGMTYSVELGQRIAVKLVEQGKAK